LHEHSGIGSRVLAHSVGDPAAAFT
jgi:hypothetical protein